MQRTLSTNFLVGILLAMLAVVGCNSNNEKQNKMKEQLIADAERLIDQMSIKELDASFNGPIGRNFSEDQTREAAKKMINDGIKNLEQTATKDINEATRLVKMTTNDAKNKKGKPKKLADIVNNIGQKIIQEAAQ